MASGSIRKVVFLIMGCDIHILEQGSQWSNIAVIRAPCTVLTASLVTSKSMHQTSSIIITTRDNQIWLLTASQLLQDNLRKTDYEVERSEEQMDSDDIFGDLLNYKAQSDNSHPQVHDPKKKSFVSQKTHTIVLRPQHLLYSMDATIIDVETMEDLVCVLVNVSGIAEVHILKICADQQCDISEDKNRIRLVESFTTGLDSSNFYHYSVKKTKCFYFVKSEWKNYPDTITAAPTSSELFLASETLLSIPIQLFTVLFGKEAACLNSPVLLLCTDNGCVYSYAVKSGKSFGQNRLGLVCQLDSDIVGILPVQIPQPAPDDSSKFGDIVSALESSLSGEHNSYSSNQTRTCLVVFSSTGKGCLFMSPTPENDYTTLIFCVPHLIKLCIAYGESIVYSTGKSVEACELKLTQEKRDGASSVTPVLRTLMRKARILKLLPFAPVSGTEDTMITAITSSFDLVPISTQLKEARPDSIAEGAHSLKDILQSIEKCSLTFKSLKKDSLNIDSILLQLNICASFTQNKAQESSTGTKASHLPTDELRDPLISCTCKVLSSQNIYKCNWSLNIVLHNNSAVSLSEDWIVLVAICDNKEGISSPEYERFNQSYSIPLSSGLRFKSSINLNLPLDRLVEVHPVPSVDVRVSLVLSFRDTNGKGRNVPPALLHKSMKVEIHRQKIDIWHFFRKFLDNNVNQEARSGYSPFSCVISRDEQWLHDEVNKLAHTRVTGKAKGCPSQDKSQIFNIRIGISELECKEHQLFNSTEAFSFLLKDSNILADNALGPHVQLEDPHGHLIMLMVNASSTASNECTDKSSTESYPIIVALKGGDAGLLLQTRAAIKSRLKISNSAVSGLQSKSCRELRKQLTFLKSVQQDLRHIQSRLVIHREDEDESLKLVCEMVDRSELLTKST